MHYRKNSSRKLAHKLGKDDSQNLLAERDFENQDLIKNWNLKNTVSTKTNSSSCFGVNLSFSFTVIMTCFFGSLFSQEDTVPMQVCNDCNWLRKGYNASAQIETRGSLNIYANGSFLYWQARQENIEIGLISQNMPEGGFSDSPFTTSYVNNITVTQPNFSYLPGFKIGLGINCDWDDWNVYFEYTWFHGFIDSKVKKLPLVSLGASGEYLYPIQGTLLISNNRPLFFQSAKQSWSLKMDFLDLSLARHFYSGRNLTLRSFFGARGVQIRQHVNTDYVGNTDYIPLIPPSEGWTKSIVHNRFVSWGIGPRTGFESNWNLGLGIRFIGNAAGDILYTRYHIHQDQLINFQNTMPTNPIVSNAGVFQSIDYLRAHVDWELGFGWGTFFDNYNWYIDLAATYGFQVFWNQNMFRCFDNDTQSETPNGNLYIHGLTFTANLNF